MGAVCAVFAGWGSVECKEKRKGIPVTGEVIVAQSIGTALFVGEL